jgi:hypothetical protein
VEEKGGPEGWIRIREGRTGEKVLEEVVLREERDLRGSETAAVVEQRKRAAELVQVVE